MIHPDFMDDYTYAAYKEDLVSSWALGKKVPQCKACDAEMYLDAADEYCDPCTEEINAWHDSQKQIEADEIDAWADLWEGRPFRGVPENKE